MNFQAYLKILNKLIEYSGLSEVEGQQLVVALDRGLMANVLGRSVGMLGEAKSEDFAKEIEACGQDDPVGVQQVLGKIIKELSLTRSGQKLIIDQLLEILEIVFEGAKKNLTVPQRRELMDLMEVELNQI